MHIFEAEQIVYTFVPRFLFSDCTRLSSVGGEKSLAAMIGTLCDAVEKEYGILIARLFRVFKPTPGGLSLISVSLIDMCLCHL